MDALRLDLVPKIRDQRLRRVIVARASGVKFYEIAGSEGVTTERARQLYNKGKDLLSVLSRIPDLLTADTPVIDTLASVRLRNACERAGVTTLGGLANLTERQFLSIKQCSRKTFNEARGILTQAQLDFKE